MKATASRFRITPNSLRVNSLHNVKTAKPPVNGEFLAVKNNKWVNSKIKLNDLDDLNVGNAVAGEFLCNDGTNWNNCEIKLDDLHDTNVGNAVAGEFLCNDGTNWNNCEIKLDDLHDTNVGNAVAGEFLCNDGTNWNNCEIKLGDLHNVENVAGNEDEVLTLKSGLWTPKTVEQGIVVTDNNGDVLLSNSTLSNATGINSVIIGTGNNVFGNNNVVAIGNDVKTNSDSDIAIGYSAQAYGTGSGTNIVIGRTAKCNGSFNIAIGSRVGSSGSAEVSRQIIIGSEIRNATGDKTICIGFNSNSKDAGVSLGAYATSSAKCIAIGELARGGQVDNNVCIGVGSQIQGSGSGVVVKGFIKNNSTNCAVLDGTAEKDNAVAIKGTASGVSSTAINGTAQGTNSIAINATASHSEAIALGADSISDNSFTVKNSRTTSRIGTGSYLETTDESDFQVCAWRAPFQEIVRGPQMVRTFDTQRLHSFTGIGLGPFNPAIVPDPNNPPDGTVLDAGYIMAKLSVCYLTNIVVFFDQYMFCDVDILLKIGVEAPLIGNETRVARFDIQHLHDPYSLLSTTPSPFGSFNINDTTIVGIPLPDDNNKLKETIEKAVLAIERAKGLGLLSLFTAPVEDSYIATIGNPNTDSFTMDPHTELSTYPAANAGPNQVDTPNLGGGTDRLQIEFSAAAVSEGFNIRFKGYLKGTVILG